MRDTLEILPVALPGLVEGEAEAAKRPNYE